MAGQSDDAVSRLQLGFFMDPAASGVAAIRLKINSNGIDGISGSTKLKPIITAQQQSSGDHERRESFRRRRDSGEPRRARRDSTGRRESLTKRMEGQLLARVAENGTPPKRLETGGSSPAPPELDPAEFHEAVYEGDLDTVEEMIEAGINIDAVDDEGNTALLLAAEGEPSIVDALVKAGCNVNHQNEQGTTALMSAVRYEDEAIVKALIKAGADLELMDEEGNKAVDMVTNADIGAALGMASSGGEARAVKRPDDTGRRNSVSQRGNGTGRRASVAKVSFEVAGLFMAIADGDADEVTKIVKSGIDINARDDDYNTPLIMAAEGEPLILQTLIEAGADLDSQNRNGVSALIAAVKYEDPEIAGMLISAGASTDLRDRKGRAAADFAQESDVSVQQEMMQLFGVGQSFTKKSAKVRGRHTRRRRSMVYVSAEVRALLDAVTEGDNTMVQELIKAGSAVNLEDEDGNSALIFAAENEPLIVATLLEAGAEIEHKNKNGITALMVAVRHSVIESIKLLVQAGASIDAADSQGLNAIDYAKETCDETVLRVLLGLNDGEARRAKTEPALPVEVMRRGSLPSCTGAGRRVRAFLDAVSEGDLERIHRLMDLGVEINVADDVGNSALHFAAEGEPNTLSLLMQAGADIDATNQWDRSPLLSAIAYGDAESVSLLIKAGANLGQVDKQGHGVEWYAKQSKSAVIQSMVKNAM